MNISYYSVIDVRTLMYLLTYLLTRPI